MNISDILAKTDHTLLHPEATWVQIRDVLEEAAFLRCASACVPPAYVHKAADYVEGTVKISSVLGFPNGYTTTRAKCYEAVDLVKDDADELDMVIHFGWLRDGYYDRILEEIKAVRRAIDGEKDGIVLKVIVETCRLNEEEKIRLCDVVSSSGADYIKTSTGFASGGAVLADVELFARHLRPGVKIKASGGISTLEEAEAFLRAGADRLGSSRLVRLAKEKNGAGLGV